MPARIACIALVILAGCGGSAPHATTQRARAKAGNLYGKYFAPKDSQGRRAAVLLIGGSSGEAPIEAAARLAKHGYPAYALWYFNAPGLPKTLANVPLEYFAKALRRLARRPGVDPRKVVMLGSSRGGEAALLVGATYPRLVHGVIGLVPNFQTGGGWTLRGRTLPFDDPIRVERINGPILVAGAKDDQVWSSAVYVDQIGLRLRDQHFRFPHRELIYAHGGHNIGAKRQVWTAILHYLRTL